MKQFPFLKLSKKIKDLSDTAAYLYFVLVYADFKKKTYGRAYLAKALGLNNLDYITELLREVEDAGLVKRSFIYGNAYADGHINKELRVSICGMEDWISVGINFISAEGTSKDKGFALKLRSLAFDDTLKITLNKKDIASELGISQPTLRKKMNSIALYYTDVFNVTYFPACEKCHLSERNVETVKAILTNGDKKSKLYKQVVWYLQNKCHLRTNADPLFDNLMGGVVGQKRRLISGLELTF